MKDKIYDLLIEQDIDNVDFLAAQARISVRFVDEKIDDGLDDGDYLMMRSYDMATANGGYYVRCFYPRETMKITHVEVNVVWESEEPTETKTDGLVAKEIVFCPILRIIVPDQEEINGYSQDEYVEELAREKLKNWSKSEIIDWVIENCENVLDSPEPYDPSYDD